MVKRSRPSSSVRTWDDTEPGSPGPLPDISPACIARGQVRTRGVPQQSSERHPFGTVGSIPGPAPRPSASKSIVASRLRAAWRAVSWPARARGRPAPGRVACPAPCAPESLDRALPTYPASNPRRLLQLTRGPRGRRAPMPCSSGRGRRRGACRGSGRGLFNAQRETPDFWSGVSG